MAAGGGGGGGREGPRPGAPRQASDGAQVQGVHRQGQGTGQCRVKDIKKKLQASECKHDCLVLNTIVHRYVLILKYKYYDALHAFNPKLN